MSRDVLKTKTVQFKIRSIMTMPELLKEGYRRNEVETLFKELHEKKLGYMIDGKRGLNPCTFFAAPSCPETYDIALDVYRFRKTATEKAEVDSTNPIIKDIITTTIASCQNLKTEEAPKSDNDGYNIGFQENKAVLIRIEKGGYSSIEDAVKATIDKFESYVTFNSNSMSRVDQIASKLRGIGFLVL